MTDDELADLKRDNAERKARRLAGQEPELWQLPEREAVRAAPSINVAVIFEHISAETAKLYKHVEKQSCLVAEAIGSETGKNERELRKSIIRCADELRLEMKQGFGRHATELMKLREIRESAQSDLKLSLLDVRKELLEIRKQIAELRVSRSKALNGGGGGLHADH